MPIRFDMRLALLVLLALGLGFVLVQQRDVGAAEDRLGALASEIAQRDVRVSCQSVAGSAVDVGWHDGSVAFDASGRPADVTLLKRPICNRLAAFPDVADDELTLRALNTIAHEAWHLSGVRDEAATQCLALQSLELAATRLGADELRARTIAVEFAHSLYPRMPPEYRSSQCREGGALDFRRETTVWP